MPEISIKIAKFVNYTETHKIAFRFLSKLMARTVGKYSTDCNIIGGIPDYCVLLDYISEKNDASGDGGFVFRTQKRIEPFQ